MQKKIFITLAAIIVLAFVANIAVAGPGCTGTKDKASMTGCSKTCARICGLKVDDKAKADCDHKGKCEATSLKITGMTCGGCESSITTALMEQDGVIKVVSIDYKTGLATVCFDPTKVESEKLAQLVTKKGYKAEVMAAVADTEAFHKACVGSAKADETEKEDF